MSFGQGPKTTTTGQQTTQSGVGGPAAQPLIVQTNPVPYLPATLDTSKATLVSRDHEAMDGKVKGETAIAASDWKFCGGGTFAAIAIVYLGRSPTDVLTWPSAS